MKSFTNLIPSNFMRRNRLKTIERVHFDLSEMTQIEVYCYLERLKEKDSLSQFEIQLKRELEASLLELMKQPS